MRLFAPIVAGGKRQPTPSLRPLFTAMLYSAWRPGRNSAAPSHFDEENQRVEEDRYRGRRPLRTFYRRPPACSRRRVSHLRQADVELADEDAPRDAAQI